MVPVLEFPDGKLLYESRIIMDLADELGGDNGLELYPADPIQKALYKLKMEEFNKYGGALYGVWFKPTDETAINALIDSLVGMEKLF